MGKDKIKLKENITGHEKNRGVMKKHDGKRQKS
jgi:hypothetical protein